MWLRCRPSAIRWRSAKVSRIAQTRCTRERSLVLSGLRPAFRRSAQLELPTSGLPAPALDRGKTMLWTVFLLFAFLWVLGFGLQIGGGQIHLLLVASALVLVLRARVDRRRLT